VTEPAAVYTAPSPRADPVMQCAARARFVEWVMYLYLAVLVVDVAATLWRISLLGRLLDEGAAGSTPLMRLPLSVRNETIEDVTTFADGITRYVGWTTLATTVLLAVVYLRWQAMARTLDPGAVRYGAAAAVWCWLVPVWSFFGPKKVVDDLWTSSGARHDPGGVTRMVPGWVTVWWLTFLGGSVIGNAAGRGVETVGGALSAEFAYLVSSTLLAVSGVLLIRLMRTLTVRQARRAAEFRFPVA
jgi:hypothetical protein